MAIQTIDPNDKRIMVYKSLPDKLRHAIRFCHSTLIEEARFYILADDIEWQLMTSVIYLPMMLPIGPDNNCDFLYLTVDK